MSITYTITSSRPSKIETSLLIVPVSEGETLPTSLAPAVRKALDKELAAYDFTGAWGSAVLLPAPAGIAASFVAVVSVGRATDSTQRQLEGLRRGIGRITQEARQHLLQEVTIDYLQPSDTQTVEQLPAFVQAAVEAIELASYRFTHYSERLARQARRGFKRVTVLVPENQVRPARRIVKQTQQLMRGVSLARELVNQPASTMSPEALVRVAKDIKKNSRAVTLKTYNRAQAARKGFSAFLAVAQGSVAEPYVIHLTYTPEKKARKKVFVVGKGITFDSGGLSLKPAAQMEDMKTDMAGAATVLGLFSVLSQIAPAVEVHGVIAACENMPSGTAYRPGDVLTAKNGKTIEVLNTDAEGRITLADALSYAAEHKPDMIIDLATLTGACLVGLGETIAGLCSNDEMVKEQLLSAAARTGEGLSVLPLPDEYRQLVESQVADLRNMATSPFGGAITAALFLEAFVNEVPWAHLDIAGPSYMRKSALPYYAPGGTGYGVRTLAQLLTAI